MASSKLNLQQGIVMRTNRDLEDRNGEIFHQVFGIALLREKIINYAIRSKKGKLSPKNAGSCRLVQRSWLESVSKCLKKTGEPLFELSLLDNDDAASDSLVNQFLAVYATESRVLASAPPFALFTICGKEVPVEDYRKTLESFLRWCSGGLVLLELNLYSYDAKPLKIPHQLSLPALRNIHIWFSESFHTGLENALDSAGVSEILTACKKLKAVSLEGRFSSSLTLPGTVTQLELSLSFSDLERFANNAANAFAKLTELTINVPNASYNGDDSIYRMLDRVRGTLKTLKIKNGFSNRKNWQKALIRFPIMTCLESCLVVADNWKWAEDRIPSLEKSLPVIKQVTWRNLTATILGQLLENSRLESAEKIKVYVEKDDVPSTNKDLPLTLTKLPMTFPNITVLDIKLPVRNDTPTLLHPIFQSMRQLEVLSVSMDQDLDSLIQSPNDFWTGMFLGMSTDEISSNTIPYIKDMSELRSLRLCLEYGYVETPIPDDVFYSGFLQMPKLLDLEVAGKFYVHSSMQQRWRMGGRRIDSAEEDTDEEYSDQGEDCPTFFD